MNSEKPTSGRPAWLTIVFIILAVLLVLFCIVAIVCAGVFFLVRVPPGYWDDPAEMKAHFTQIEGGLRQYEVSMGEYPTTEQGLDALLQCPADLANPDQWGGPYVQELPLDPWDNPYQYENLDGYPQIWSMGPDGINDTEVGTNDTGDDIGYWLNGPPGME